MAVVVLSSLAAVTLPTVFDCLHLLTATTSVGTPLIVLGLIISSGWSASSATIAVIAAVVVVTSPAMSAATGRLAAQREGVIDVDWPA
ncbi:MAG TPA: monovalent cation/H(+) antiporter subunit G [Mycobacterium sp.]|nr:monovalent cation/H(+) antiporter subunit G [Mycobacterium sp.]